MQTGRLAVAVHAYGEDPARAERLCMAIAIATWWLLSVGGEAEEQDDKPLDIKIPSVPGAVRRRGKRWRVVGARQKTPFFLKTGTIPDGFFLRFSSFSG